MAYLRQHWRKVLVILAVPFLSGALLAACLAALVIILVLTVCAVLPALLLIACSARSSTRLPAMASSRSASGRDRAGGAFIVQGAAAGRRDPSRRSQTADAMRSTGW